MEKKNLAPGKFKFAKSKHENIQKSICLTKYSKDDIHSRDTDRLLKNFFLGSQCTRL